MPTDSYGRNIDYLRLSVIDHCNLRCVYCMPIRDLQFVQSEQLLTATEIETVVRCAADVGFRKVRLTGGEPTLRSDLVEIVRRVARTDGIEDVSITTNGIFLPRMLDQLVAAGLQRVNLHIDSLNPDRVKQVMRFASLDSIMAGVEAVQRAGLAPVKVNCVVVRGYNDRDVVDLAKMAIERDWFIRFIELMPLGGGECAQLSLSQFVPSDETQALIEQSLGILVPLPQTNAADESRNFRIDGSKGVIGFISPVSYPYCGDCNRMRLTADGKLHLCLLNDAELDVRSVLRNGGGDKRIRSILMQAVKSKPTGHRLEEGISTQRRNMFQIGG